MVGIYQNSHNRYDMALAHFEKSKVSKEINKTVEFLQQMMGNKSMFQKFQEFVKSNSA